MIASTDSERMAPRQMGILAERIEEIVQTLSGWGVRVSGAGRLHEAMRLLRRMSKAGRFPDDRTEPTSLAHAMRDAQEFTEIADVLPENRLHPVATDLQRAMGGVLGGAGHEVVQYQTQLWFGACLVHAGASVAVPLDSSRPNAEEVLRLVAWGHGNQAIGKKLDISPRTVETYRSRIAEKLGLHSRPEIVRYALLRAWLSPD